MSNSGKEKKIPLAEPLIAGNESKYVGECLETGWVSSAGEYVNRFEDNIRRYTGAGYAVATVNGTAALQTALLLAGVEPDDEVIVPTVTFIAPVNVVKYLNARPVFMDCDDYYNIDAAKTVDFIEQETAFKDGASLNKKSGKRIRAIVPVHVFGNAADLEELSAVCRERNIEVVEDATESLGTYYTEGKYKDRYTGTVGEIGCYSFNGNKIITTGGGGMIVTANRKYAQRARYLTNQAKDDAERYIHNEVGYNYRLTNIQAALGVAQLERLEEFIEIKARHYRTYREKLDEIDGLHLAEVPPYARNNCWMYALRVEKEKYGKDREELMACLAEKGIQSRPLWHLNHLQKPYQDCRAYRVEKADKLLAETLNIPCGVGLKEEEIQRVIEVLQNG